MSDTRLERRLREALGAVDDDTAPAFETVFGAANERVRRRRRRRRATGLAAAVVGAAAVALLAWFALPAPQHGGSTLVAELTSSTSWQAPSDAWRTPPRNDLLRTLPEIGTTRINEGDLRL